MLTPKPGTLRALIRRKLTTCDAFDLPVRDGIPQHMVWAHGEAWPSYHGSATRGNIGE
jgi:hypothetical protein